MPKSNSHWPPAVSEAHRWRSTDWERAAPDVQPGGATRSLAAAGEQVACYQAALMADEQNYLAANELGVIFADNGRLEAARDLFGRSLAVSEHAATWQNLAVSLARLGDTAAASRAARRADELRTQLHDDVTGDNVRWVDSATFAKNPSPSDGLFPPATATRPADAQSPPARPRRSGWRCCFLGIPRSDSPPGTFGPGRTP